MTPPSERPLTLGQADQAREDFAAIESDLEFVMSQLASNFDEIAAQHLGFSRERQGQYGLVYHITSYYDCGGME